MLTAVDDKVLDQCWNVSDVISELIQFKLEYELGIKLDRAFSGVNRLIHEPEEDYNE